MGNSNKSLANEIPNTRTSRSTSKLCETEMPKSLRPNSERPTNSVLTDRTLRSRKRRIDVLEESKSMKDEVRITRSQTKKAVDTKNVGSKETYSNYHTSSTRHRKRKQQDLATDTDGTVLKPRTRSKVASSAFSSSSSSSVTSTPIRLRPSVGQWTGPTLTAHVDRQHTYQSHILREMKLLENGLEDKSLEVKQLQSAFKCLDSLPEETTISYTISPCDLINDYQELIERNFVDKVNFGDTLESALTAIELKLKQLEPYDSTVDADIEDEMREYKRSLKSLAALRESECLVRLKEKEEDEEMHMRQIRLGVQSTVTPIQLEISELCKRKIWWVTEKEWFKGAERQCNFRTSCKLCLRKQKRRKTNGSKSSIPLKMPRISIFNPAEHEQLEKFSDISKTLNNTSRYKSRSFEMQKKACATREELQRLHASLSFVDQYNSTCRKFLPG